MPFYSAPSRLKEKIWGVSGTLSRFQTNLSEKEQIRDFYAQLAVS